MMSETATVLEEAIQKLKEEAESFDSKTYFENGEFAEQMIAACEEGGVEVQGEFPIYEMFPYRVKIDAENQDVYLDRKKIQCMRPQSLVSVVKTGQEKLNEASFNASAFASELVDAYDMAVLKLNSIFNYDLFL